MNLPNDIARCNGRSLPADTNPHQALFLAQECRECLRRIADRPDAVWMMASPAPTDETCHMRIGGAHD